MTRSILAVVRTITLAEWLGGLLAMLSIGVICAVFVLAAVAVGVGP